MKKIIIEFCQQCYHFDDNWGTRCFHPEVAPPHREGGRIPREIDTEIVSDAPWRNLIPKWCPLKEEDL